MKLDKRVGIMLKRICMLISITVLLSSCFGMKSGSKSPAGKYYESFFLGEGKNQYFIKAIEFDNDKSTFNIDITIRDFEFKESGGSANFTIIAEELISKIDTLKIISNDFTFKIVDIQRMFFEKKDDEYVIRSTCKLSSDQISAFYASPTLSIEVSYSNSSLKYESSNSINDDRNDIFSDLIQLLYHY